MIDSPGAKRHAWSMRSENEEILQAERRCHSCDGRGKKLRSSLASLFVVPAGQVESGDVSLADCTSCGGSGRAVEAA